MSFFRNLFGLAKRPPRSSASVVAQSVEDSFRNCRMEPLEDRKVLSANPLIVGAVYIEGDGGTDAEGDQFYISYEGGSTSTEVTRIVIDGNQDGSSTLGNTDVYFDITPNNQLGVGEAHGFEWSSDSSGISSTEVTATVFDGGTRLVIDLVDFKAGDVLAFTIDVDQFFSSKPHDQVTSGIEFAGSALELTVVDPHYNFSPDPTVTNSTFEYSFDFGSDNVDDTGVLSQLPSEFNRTASNGNNSIENRTAGARQDFALSPKPISISGTVYHDRNLDQSQGTGEEGIGNVLLTLQVKDSFGNWTDIPNGGNPTLTTTTDSNGDYSFGENLGLAPGTYRVIESQPTGWISSGSQSGTVDGTPTGSSDGVDVLTEIEIPLGDMHAVDYDFGEHKTVSLSGFVGITDHDGNCVEPTSSSFRGIANVLITAIDQNGTQFTTRTDTDGFYEFNDLLAGTYTLIESQPVGYIDGNEGVGTVNGVSRGAIGGNDRLENIVLTSGEAGINYHFCESEPSSISGTVFYDKDNDGIQDNNENGISGVTINLLDAGGSVIDTQVTDNNGNYNFDGLVAGNYMVEEIQPTGYLDGIDTVGTIGGVTTGTRSNDKFSQITLGSGEHGIDYDFGEVRPGLIEGRVHTDINDNCELDAGTGEVALSGVTIQLIDDTGKVIREVQTDADGLYRFDGLYPGTYSIRQVQPGDYFSHGEVLGTFRASGNAGPGTSSENLFTQITLGAGRKLVDYNFCEAPAAEISGFVFQDGGIITLADGQTLTREQANQLRNGQLTSDDTRLSGVVLELRNGITGDPIDASDLLPGVYGTGPVRTTTDANGFYEFRGLRQGNYAVFEIQPEGYRDHLDSAGTSQGIAINPTDTIDPFILSTLSAGVDPADDAILRIAINWGDSSEQNNFSEILTTTDEGPPRNPPPSNPPSTAIPKVPPVFVMPSMVRGGGLPNQNVSVGGLTTVPGGSEYSWHLSVINGGTPRGNRASDVEWNNISYLAESSWMSVSMSEGRWLISRENVDSIEGTPDTYQVIYGMHNGIPLAADFNGDGTDEIMVYSDGFWFVDFNGNRQWDKEDLWAELGSAVALPVVGDWDGDGKDDIGIYGPQWVNDARAAERDPGLPDLDNRLAGDPKNLPPVEEDATSGKRKIKLGANGNARSDAIDHVFNYGVQDDIPVTGDWNGDGVRNIGVFQNGKWTLDTDGDGRLTKNDQVVNFGQSGDIPVVGDFNGDGIEQIGVFRNGTWIVDTNSNGELDVTDKVFELGGKGDRPVVGDFDGDGLDEPAVYQPIEATADGSTIGNPVSRKAG